MIPPLPLREPSPQAVSQCPSGLGSGGLLIPFTGIKRTDGGHRGIPRMSRRENHGWHGWHGWKYRPLKTIRAIREIRGELLPHPRAPFFAGSQCVRLFVRDGMSREVETARRADPRSRRVRRTRPASATRLANLSKFPRANVCRSPGCGRRRLRHRAWQHGGSPRRHRGGGIPLHPTRRASRVCA